LEILAACCQYPGTAACKWEQLIQIKKRGVSFQAGVKFVVLSGHEDPRQYREEFKSIGMPPAMQGFYISTLETKAVVAVCFWCPRRPTVCSCSFVAELASTITQFHNLHTIPQPV